MIKVLILLLITISNFALGNPALIKEAIQANDPQALESALSNTEADEYLKSEWEYRIEEALRFSPQSVLPLLQFGYKHDFHNQSSDYDTQINNLLKILKFNKENLSSFSIKYYKNAITEIFDWEYNNSLESLSSESLTLLLDNGLNIKIYTSIIKSKLKDLIQENNTEAIQSFVQFAKNKDIELISNTSDLLEIITRDDESTAFIITNYPHLIQTLDDDSRTKDKLKSIPQERLNLLLNNGLKTELYIVVTCEKIQELSRYISNKLKELLDKLIFNKDDKEMWISKLKSDYEQYSYSPESTIDLLRFVYSKNIKIEISAYKFISIIERCDQETASMVLKNNPEIINSFSYYYTINERIPMENLNLLLENGLNPEVYASTICDKIKNLPTTNNANPNEYAESINSLLEQIALTSTGKQTMKSIIIKSTLFNLPIETFKTIIEFAKSKNIEAISNKDDLVNALKTSNEETAAFLIEKYPHIIKTLRHSAQDYQTPRNLQSLSSDLLNQLLANGLDINLYTSVIGVKIGDAITNKNKELALSLLGSIEVTNANKYAWSTAFQTYVMPNAYHTLPDLVLTLLQFGDQHELELLNSYTLSGIIQKCDEETTLFAITHYPNEVPDAGYQLFHDGMLQSWNPETQSTVQIPNLSLVKELSINLIMLLLEHNCKNLLIHLPALDNGLKALDLLMQKDPTLVLKHPDFSDFFTEIIEQGRFDILEFLSQSGIKLETIIETNSDIEARDIIASAVMSTEHGNTDMLNHVLNTINAHGHPAALAAAANLANGTLFNNLLQKGYTADPNSAAEINLFGLVFAIKSGNKQAISYYLKHGVDPNAAFDKIEGMYFLLYSNTENFSIQADQKIELLELLIAHGLKITGLHIADCAQAGSLDLIKYFKDKGHNTQHSAIFVAACRSNNIELIDFLLEDGANIQDPNALVAGVHSDSLQGGIVKVVQHLIEKGANPNNLMALNQALQGYDSEIKIAKYLVEKGAKVEPRCIISAGLSGNASALQWILDETNTPITAELEVILSNSSDEIIKYTLNNFVPKDSALIGITNHGYHFADGIGGVASKLMEKNSNVFIIPLTEQLASDDSIMIKFSGFINPGAGDSYPKLPEFSLKDMDEKRMEDYECLYQQVISFAKKHDIPYLGICLGSQHLILNNEGYLQPVQGHGGSITIHFEKGSIPHFMTLLPHEKAKALQSCLLDDISVENAEVAHGFAGVKYKLGRNVKLGAISAKNKDVPESVSYGRNLIGVQFHPERAYFREDEGKINRQKILLDNFFENTLDYQKSRRYALESGLHYSEVKDNIYNANQKLLNHLESCAKNPQHSSNDHFWAKDLGSSKITTDKTQNDTINILTGLTPKDIALARDGDDLVLIIKNSGEMLSIESHFAPNNQHRVKSIDFADGSRLILNNDNNVQDQHSTHMENQPNFYRNATALD